MIFTVTYTVGTYSGERTVSAEDGEEAIAKVKRWVRRETSMGMALESYRVSDESDASAEDGR